MELCHHIRGGNHQWLPLWIMWTAWVSAQTKNNDELHLHTSGLCEHLGFLARQGKHDEQCLHPSGLCKHLGFLNSQDKTLNNISTPLDCANTWGFCTGKENNDERLNASGLCEHLGFLNSQRTMLGYPEQCYLT